MKVASSSIGRSKILVKIKVIGKTTGIKQDIIET